MLFQALGVNRKKALSFFATFLIAVLGAFALYGCTGPVGNESVVDSGKTETLQVGQLSISYPQSFSISDASNALAPTEDVAGNPITKSEVIWDENQATYIVLSELQAGASDYESVLDGVAEHYFGNESIASRNEVNLAMDDFKIESVEINGSNAFRIEAVLNQDKGIEGFPENVQSISIIVFDASGNAVGQCDATVPLDDRFNMTEQVNEILATLQVAE